MDENHQDKTESKLIATEDKLRLPPLSPQDQKKLDRHRKDRKKAKLSLIIIGISASFVGVIALVYIGFRFDWSLWVVISLMLIGIVLLFLFIRTVYSTQWAGFRGYDKITKEYTLDGQLAKITKEHQPGKTFWDWLQLLIIPLILAGATIGLGLWQAHLADLQHQSDQVLAQQRYQNDRKIAQDNRQNDLQLADEQQQDATLTSYLNDMSDLLLYHNLRNSKPGDMVSQVARVRTLTVLRRLQSERNDTVLQFLQDAHLIGIPNAVFNFINADLSGDNLAFANLNGVNLSGASLGGADLSEAKLNGASLKGTILSLANLDAASLQGADLRGAGLYQAKFQYADLSNANLRNAITDKHGVDLSNANLSGADLSNATLHADLSNAKLRNANLRNANLSATSLDYADLRGANLSGADLLRTSWQGTHLDGAILTNAYLSSFDLNSSDLQVTVRSAYLSGSDAHLYLTGLVGADLHGANLPNALLDDTDLRGADLRGANLHFAYLQVANLSGANLSSANLSNADLRSVNLSSANLSGADLRFADLGEGANLSSADLRFADLDGAEVTEEQLATASSLEGAIMPDGTKHP